MTAAASHKKASFKEGLGQILPTAVEYTFIEQLAGRGQAAGLAAAASLPPAALCATEWPREQTPAEWS